MRFSSASKRWFLKREANLSNFDSFLFALRGLESLALNLSTSMVESQTEPAKGLSDPNVHFAPFAFNCNTLFVHDAIYPPTFSGQRAHS